MLRQQLGARGYIIRAEAGYDVTERLREYQARGDREVWLLHPYERTLTRWVQQAGGSYTEHHPQGGIVTPASLPAVYIDLDALFSMVRPEPRDRCQGTEARPSR